MPRNLPNIKQPNLKNKVYELLLTMIVDGKYRENELLPSERILGEELGVSRTVIREAIKSLETRGIVQAIHGKGIRVVPSTSSDISNALMLYLRRKHRTVSLKDLIEVRYAIETEIAACAATRATASDIRALKAILLKMEKAIGDVNQYVRTDLDLHLKIAYMTHNILFITILESLLIPLRRSFEETVEVHDNEQTFQQHMNIVNCLISADAAGAKEMMARHLQHIKKKLRTRGKL